MTGTAVDTLVDLRAVRKHPAVRFGAARTLLEMRSHQYDAVVIIRGLNEIEAAKRSHRR